MGERNRNFKTREFSWKRSVIPEVCPEGEKRRNQKTTYVSQSLKRQYRFGKYETITGLLQQDSNDKKNLWTQRKCWIGGQLNPPILEVLLFLIASRSHPENNKVSSTKEYLRNLY